MLRCPSSDSCSYSLEIPFLESLFCKPLALNQNSSPAFMEKSGNAVWLLLVPCCIRILVSSLSPTDISVHSNFVENFPQKLPVQSGCLVADQPCYA